MNLYKVNHLFYKTRFNQNDFNFSKYINTKDMKFKSGEYVPSKYDQFCEKMIIEIEYFKKEKGEKSVEVAEKLHELAGIHLIFGNFIKSTEYLN